MDEPVERVVGRRIRQIREGQGLSLKALAARCQLSLNAISRIERGDSSPTVSSLHRLAAALDVPITDFFGSDRGQRTVLLRHMDRLCTRGEGAMLESLGSGLPGQRLAPFLLTLLPGAASSPQPILHAGEEFALCLAGEVDYSVGDQQYRLEAGDTLLFHADQPHLCRNIGLEQATVLFVIRAPEEESRMCHQRHLLSS